MANERDVDIDNQISINLIIKFSITSLNFYFWIIITRVFGCMGCVKLIQMLLNASYMHYKNKKLIVSKSSKQSSLEILLFDTLYLSGLLIATYLSAIITQIFAKG